jgi:hypothetical protein
LLARYPRNVTFVSPADKVLYIYLENRE